MRGFLSHILNNLLLATPNTACLLQVCLGASRPGKADDASPPGVAAALFDLLAWVPRLAGSLSPEARWEKVDLCISQSLVLD